jgi:serine/threonine protein kinase
VGIAMSIFQLNNYDVLATPIGKGLQSRVYKGFDHVHRRTVAIKKRVNIASAQNEAIVISKYGKHPFLPQFYDYFTFKNRAYIVMEYIDGQPLGKGRQIKKRNRGDAVAITKNVLKGLQHLHNQGILHCDILPKNIMISQEDVDKVKIVDFGCSVEKSEAGIYKGERRHKKVTGKPLEFRKQILLLDDTSDIYNCAYLCACLLRGRPPKWNKALQAHTCSIEDKLLNACLQKAMNKNQHLRYQHVQEFIDDLERLSL